MITDNGWQMENLCINCQMNPIFIKKWRLCQTCYMHEYRKGFIESKLTPLDISQKLIQKHGSEIINDFALAKSDYNFKLNDIAIKYGFTRERARQIFLKLYQQPYGFYQDLLYNERITDKIFGQLKVMGKIENNNKWVCTCNCGKITIAPGNQLLNGQRISCGCAKKTHGMSRTKAHIRWRNMIGRCSNKNHRMYKWYGERGIKVCERWLKFENFYADMGECPKGLTIERIDNDGNYEPANCTWATYKSQANNRRQRQGEIFLEFKGEKLTKSQWSRKLGLSYSTLAHRLRIWPIEKAFTEKKRR